jgi:hypothetical protein
VLPGAYGGLEPLPLRQRGVPLASKRQHGLPVVYVGLARVSYLAVEVDR